MKSFSSKFRFLLFVSLFSLSYFAMADNKPVSKLTPIPLPKTLRVESSSPLALVWETLTEKEKHLAYHLTQAGQAGRTFLFYESHPAALKIRDVLTKAFAKKNLAQTKQIIGADAFPEFIIYAAKFLDGGGPYASSNRKYILKTTTPDKISALLNAYAPKTSKADQTEIVALLTDVSYQVQQHPDGADGAGLEDTGTNLYQKGIRGEEVRQAVDKGTLNTTLNCRVERGKDGQLLCPAQTTNSPGFIGVTLRNIVKSLKSAEKYASTAHQRAQMEAMVKYFNSGNIDDFRAANIEWVQDRAASVVDFMIGWVEVYEDWLARIASWESYVQIVDRKISLTAEALAKKAQRFEDGMPYDTKYKKTFPKDYSPPAIMVYYFQEISSFRSGGYNLPNFDDIRRDVGAKNVIRLPLPGEDKDPEIKALYREMLEAFAPANKIDPELEAREKVWQNIVLMHEIIGHGSGTYNQEKYPNNVDPISALGSLGSALEEERADLAALTFMSDPLLIEVGIYSNSDEAKKIRDLSYDYYLADFLRRTSGQRTFSESHQRGHWLAVNTLLKNKAIEWIAKDGKSKATVDNQVLAVKDYDKFQQVVRNLLGTLQDIKAERKEKALQDLFTDDAPLDAINSAWAQAIIRRGEDLKINAGYVEQPWRISPNLKYQTLGGKTLESVAPFWEAYYR